MTRVTVQLLSLICHRGEAENTKENFLASSSFSRRLHDEMEMVCTIVRHELQYRSYFRSNFSSTYDMPR